VGLESISGCEDFFVVRDRDIAAFEYALFGGDRVFVGWRLCIAREHEGRVLTWDGRCCFLDQNGAGVDRTVARVSRFGRENGVGSGSLLRGTYVFIGP
jgi:hypothetical protein